MLKILHTADWHVGRLFDRQFDAEVAAKLARERLCVIDRILGLAHQYDVDAVLCAGDLFDSPNPGDAWWRELAQN
jgi:DNA repair exonuclease SbcCD nuclease subunit